MCDIMNPVNFGVLKSPPKNQICIIFIRSLFEQNIEIIQVIYSRVGTSVDTCND